MNVYYLFKINDSYAKLTRNNPFNLYMILNGIYRSSIKDIKEAYHLYHSIHKTFTKAELNSFFKLLKKDDNYQVYNKMHAYHNYFTKEESRLFVHQTYLLLKSNKKNPVFLTYIQKAEHIFLCDFKTNTYFWLDEFMKKNLSSCEKKGIMVVGE